ncbi:MAG: flagellar assembly peptidoglycan hydrolase FlgJ [Reinekea sp.]
MEHLILPETGNFLPETIMSVPMDAAFNYNDLNGLESLKTGARKDNPEALRAVAQQFESMFMSLILRSMRDATDVMASDLDNSYQTRFYRDMHDQQLALSVSQMGGFGLADILYEQLSDTQPERAGSIAGLEVKPLDQSIRSRLPSHVGYPGGSPSPAVNKTDEVSTLTDFESFASPADFIEKLMPVAEQVAAKIGVDPKVLVAQAALETGWGSAMIQTENGESANNFFGIKADSRWSGDTTDTVTTEFLSGKAFSVSAPFRVYASAQDSFLDYVEFLSSAERYQSALQVADDLEQYTRALQDAGYATDPDYAEKIQRIVQSNWFNQV